MLDTRVAAAAERRQLAEIQLQLEQLRQGKIAVGMDLGGPPNNEFTSHCQLTSMNIIVLLWLIQSSLQASAIKLHVS